MKKIRQPENNVRIIRATNLLRSKIGTGKISPEVIQECQKVIEENDIDFSPLAREFLDSLAQTIRLTRAREISEQQAVERMAGCVMQLKANAAVFHYRLVGNLAQVMLGFLENLTHIDDNALEIVDAHLKTRAYMGGDALTMGDIALGCGIWRWMGMPIERPAMPHLQRWFDALAQRPAFRKVVMQPLS